MTIEKSKFGVNLLATRPILPFGPNFNPLSDLIQELPPSILLKIVAFTPDNKLSLLFLTLGQEAAYITLALKGSKIRSIIPVSSATCQTFSQVIPPFILL